MVETKLGDTYEGKIEDIDKFMNLHLKQVVITSADGEKFFKVFIHLLISIGKQGAHQREHNKINADGPGGAHQAS